MAEALYRKYRPQIFEDVVGQEHIERTLKNAIEQDKVSHAYLFTGPRGTGKTTTARLLAKALLCVHGPTPEPDGSCDDCKMIAKGEHPDVYELDAASRTGVENVREEIIERVQFSPARGRYKIYIIDEVHMLSTAAFNALLKTLEEPPSHVVFVLATTDPQKVPETIHSRCQRFDFRRLSAEAMVSRLGAICVKEEVSFEGEALDLIAHRAEGGMRNALTSLEQLIAFGEGSVTLSVAERLLGGADAHDLADIVRLIGKRDVAACFRWTAEFMESGADVAQFVQDLGKHVRNLYVMALSDADIALEVGDAERRELLAEVPLFGRERLARLLSVLGNLSSELKTATNPRLSFEIALTRMVRPDSDLTLESLAERIEALEASAMGQRPPLAFDAHLNFSPMSSSEIAASAKLDVADGIRSDASSSEYASPASTLKPLPVPTSAVCEPAGEKSVSLSASGQDIPPVDVAPKPVLSSAASSAQSASSAADPLAASCAVSEVTAPSQPSQGGSHQMQETLQNPAALARLWHATLLALKKNKAAYGVLFLNVKPVYEDAARMLYLEFPAENLFAYKAVQKSDIQQAVSEALCQSCGEVLPFAFRQASTGGARISEDFTGSVVSTPDRSTVLDEPVVPKPALADSVLSTPPPTAVATPAAPVPAFTDATTAESVQASPPSPPVPGAPPPDDLEAILAASFGQDVVVEKLPKGDADPS